MRLVFIFEQKRFCHFVHGDTQSHRKCQQSFSKYLLYCLQASQTVLKLHACTVGIIQSTILLPNVILANRAFCISHVHQYKYSQDFYEIVAETRLITRDNSFQSSFLPYSMTFYVLFKYENVNALVVLLPKWRQIELKMGNNEEYK